MLQDEVCNLQETKKFFRYAADDSEEGLCSHTLPC